MLERLPPGRVRECAGQREAGVSFRKVGGTEMGGRHMNHHRNPGVTMPRCEAGLTVRHIAFEGDITHGRIACERRAPCLGLSRGSPFSSRSVVAKHS